MALMNLKIVHGVIGALLVALKLNYHVGPCVAAQSAAQNNNARINTRLPSRQVSKVTVARRQPSCPRPMTVSFRQRHVSVTSSVVRDRRDEGRMAHQHSRIASSDPTS
jgi:hypothetical protein